MRSKLRELAVGMTSTLSGNDSRDSRYKRINLGHPQPLLLLLADSEYCLCVSSDIYREYDEVIRRPRFRRKPDEIEMLLGSIREHAIWVTPVERLRVCADPDDDIFLECAQAANAHYLVTGNVRHFPSVWRQTRIEKPRGFLDSEGL